MCSYPWILSRRAGLLKVLILQRVKPGKKNSSHLHRVCRIKISSSIRRTEISIFALSGTINVLQLGRTRGSVECFPAIIA